MSPSRTAFIALWFSLLWAKADGEASPKQNRGNEKGHPSEIRLLYVAVPGIRDYLEYGGHGILVYDIDRGHRFVKRIESGGRDTSGKPLNVKGICASAATNRLYVSTTRTLTSLDLLTEKILWEKSYPGGSDRMAISPDGKLIYLPSLEKEHWHVIDAATGRVIAKIITNSGAHNTIYGLDGAWIYLGGLKSSWLNIADAKTHSISKRVGPFSNVIRPFTVNASQTRCYVNVNELLGFEVGDLTTGKMISRVEVAGYKPGPTKRHGCPSHGIALTPDESEIWLTDAFNTRIHIYDASATPPRQKESIRLKDQPGWITFSIDGQYAYPSTGEVIETSTRKIVTALKDENGNEVQSEKMLEIDFLDAKPIQAGDQFGLGRRVPKH